MDLVCDILEKYNIDFSKNENIIEIEHNNSIDICRALKEIIEYYDILKAKYDKETKEITIIFKDFKISIKTRKSIRIVKMLYDYFKRINENLLTLYMSKKYIININKLKVFHFKINIKDVNTNKTIYVVSVNNGQVEFYAMYTEDSNKHIVMNRIKKKNIIEKTL